MRPMDKLKKIIVERLDELGVSAIEAAKRGGLERGYIRDFIEGRKKTFRQDKIPLLAEALELDSKALVLGEKAILPQKGSDEENATKAKITDVPLIAWVSAGQAIFQEGIFDFSDFPTVPVCDLPKGDWIALRVDGVSMNRKLFWSIWRIKTLSPMPIISLWMRQGMSPINVTARVKIRLFSPFQRKISSRPNFMAQSPSLAACAAP